MIIFDVKLLRGNKFGVSNCLTEFLILIATSSDANNAIQK